LALAIALAVRLVRAAMASAKSALALVGKSLSVTQSLRIYHRVENFVKKLICVIYQISQTIFVCEVRLYPRGEFMLVGFLLFLILRNGFV